MKRLVFIVCFAFAAVVYAAGQIVSSSSLVVTKAALPDVKPGYEQSIDLSFDFLPATRLCFDINYIGGWRFNRMFYAGLGTGLDIDPFSPETYLVINYDGYNNNLDLGKAVNIPLYAHGRLYFTQKRWMPFVGLSVGGLFSTRQTVVLRSYDHESGYREMCNEDYGTSGFLLNVMAGADYRMTANSDFYISLGFKGITKSYVANWSEYDITVRQRFCAGFDMHVGFTF